MLQTKENKTMEQFLLDSIKFAFKDKLEQETDRILKEAKASLEKSMAEIVASISIHLLKQVSIDYFGDSLRIHIKMEKGE